MAGPPPAALLLGAAAAFLLLSKKKGEPTDSGKTDVTGADEPDLGGEQQGGPKIPDVKSQEELNELLKEQQEATKAEVRANLQWSLLPEGRDIPNDMEHNSIWVSEDCEAAAVGRDFKPIWKAGGKLYSPASFWNEHGDNLRPNAPMPGKGGDSLASYYARNLINQNDDLLSCQGKLPDPADFESEEDYGNGWTQVRNLYPALAELYDYIYAQPVGVDMLAAWREADYQAWLDWEVERHAKWAKQHFPQYNLTDKTDEAYKLISETNFGDAPEVLDPDNPEHEPYIDIWLALRDAIAAL